MKKTSKGADGSARVRFIVLEAEVENGDLDQITTAIQNALRPRTVVEQRPVFIEQRSPGEDVADELLVDEIEEEVAAPRRPKQPAAKRTFPTPKVVEVDWDVEPSIDDFTKAHPAETMADRFLITLAWFKEVGRKAAVTPDEVYTVFRKLGWPTNIKDFSQPLRGLKGRQWVNGGAKGGFSINHLGLDRVKKFGEA